LGNSVNSRSVSGIAILVISSKFEGVVVSELAVENRVVNNELGHWDGSSNLASESVLRPAKLRRLHLLVRPKLESCERHGRAKFDNGFTFTWATCNCFRSWNRIIHLGSLFTREVYNQRGLDQISGCWSGKYQV
jgi:hypothetical protein